MNPEENRIPLTRPLAYIDTEWTGLNPETRRIISVAVVRFEPDGTQRSAYWLLNPRSTITPESTRIHGIQQEDVEGQPGFEEVAGEIAEILEGTDLAGYSVNSDTEILETEMRLAGREWTPEGRSIVDAYRLWLAREPRTLGDAYRRFVGSVPETLRPHDARDDLTMTIGVVNALADGKTAAELHTEGHPGQVDPAGKFRRNEDGATIYNFGQYRGLPVRDHPDYLIWMLSKDFAPSTLQAARRLLSECGHGHGLDGHDRYQADSA